jgi:hypothetical protein
MNQASKQLKVNVGRTVSFLAEHKQYLLGAFVLGFCLLPGDALAGLDDQLKKVNTLMTGSVLKVGLGGSTILGCIFAAAKGALGMAAAIMGVGVALSYYLGWIQGDSFVQ